MSKLILGDGLLGSELIKITKWDYISRKKDGIDLFTDKLLPRKAVFRIKSSDDIEGLAKLINNLLLNEKIIISAKKELLKVKSSLKDWDKRINYEIKLLENIKKN